MFNKLQKIIFCAIIICVSYNLNSQTNYSSLFTEDISFNRPAWLENSVSGAVILNIDRQQLQNVINLKEDKIKLTIPAGNGMSTIIDLVKYDILTPDSKICAGTNNGERE